MVKLINDNFLKVMILIMFVLVTSCKEDDKANSEVTSENTEQGCPQRPQKSLKEANINTIEFDENELAKSGIINQNETIGYRLEGKSEQELKYETNDNICVWIFTPENEVLKQTELPMDGTYIMQVTTPAGSRSFDLTVNLESPSSPAKEPKNEAETPKRISPREAVTKYYTQINQRQYDQSWNQLSQNFKQAPNGFSSYVNWWDKVRNVEIGEVQLIDESENRATVNAQLTYAMEDGEQYKDPKDRIILTWDSQQQTWLINDKFDPSR